ncbi:MAG: 4-hydroxythreonine-4-phosphate dehydrogenase PdxA [Odoribacter sp.]|nr:4-hydroxythreonine-4-phosphate dehydrogenase PdxA [Odoribacter sp.]
MQNKIKVGITHGDINGIGYEVILKALADERMLELCTPVVYGSAKIAASYRKALGMGPVPFIQIDNASDAREGANNMVNVVGEEVHAEPGVPSPDAGKAAFIALERAVADLKAGDIDVLVTAPINKSTIQSSQFSFPGHTEYLESVAADESAHALMILCNDVMRVALLSTHTPIAKVAATVSKDEIIAKLKTFNNSLQRDFGIHSPRIAVLGLNPHAGDGGLLGAEEAEIIAPAIAAARDEKVLAFGPYPADGFFGAGQFRKFDGILAMYHDQGLAPFKALAMNSGVNFTAGLPFVRTSPDHGTGFDIAGKDLASEDSLRQAIYAAVDIFRNRNRFDEAHRSPLRRQYYDKGSDNVVLDLSGD